MKSCRKQNPIIAARPASGRSDTTAAPRHAVMPETNVRRYVHPIRTVKPQARTPVEETLSYVLEALSRQSEQLDEVLRRLECDNLDTM